MPHEHVPAAERLSEEVVDPHAYIRPHLNRLSAEHVEDALADYLSPERQEELGLTDTQVEAIRSITVLVVREFAWDVHTEEITLSPDTRVEEGDN